MDHSHPKRHHIAEWGNRTTKEGRMSCPPLFLFTKRKKNYKKAKGVIYLAVIILFSQFSGFGFQFAEYRFLL